MDLRGVQCFTVCSVEVGKYVCWLHRQWGKVGIFGNVTVKDRTGHDSVSSVRTFVVT